MISNEKVGHYRTVKTLSALVRGTNSKHHGEFYCPNYLLFFTIRNKRESQKKVCENKYFCDILMPSEGTEI